MNQEQMAIDVASQLFGKVVHANHWKVAELMLLSEAELESLHQMARNRPGLGFNGKNIRREF